jgi:hypothetical protein
LEEQRTAVAELEAELQRRADTLELMAAAADTATANAQQGTYLLHKQTACSIHLFF